MLKNLRIRITLLILGGAVFSIVLVSVITNVTLFRKFDIYMKNEQQNRINEIIDVIKYFYSTENGWTERNLKNIMVSPLVKDFDIIIRDAEGRVVLAHPMEYDMFKMHHEMMRMMSSHMVRGIVNPDEYVTKKYGLYIKGEYIGSVEIGYIGPFTISEREIQFTRGINISIIYAAIVSIFVSILLGFYSSGVISKPILKITEAANNIRRGNLDIHVEIPENVRELKELSDSINHLARSLGEQENLRKRLTQDISHELRTPLTILQSHIEAISDGIWEPSREKLDICRNEVNRLIKLVEQLKDLSNIENHKITLDVERYNLSDSLKEILKAFSLEFKNKNIEIKTDIDENVYIDADKDKISRAVINILSNALKYTNPGGTVLVALTEKGRDVEIVVKDTGIGIDEKDLPYIFERFYRSDKSRSRKTGGAGIGLTIAKSLIEAHKGKISVESQKDRGSKFTIVIPIKTT
ncbi:sensor histidine kinase [Thermoanaerobacterium sp. DL9XJH110]|uniref:sensor histidine kinase n=1 Tax=Thermoanaerobacterium sp. DL9XJH110 TaxID=3386643 RepID=UPI003BB748D1